MDGIHDMGGMHGLGAVNHTPAEPVFKGEWERVVFGTLNVALGGGAAKLDAIRSSIEQMPAAEYLTTSYFEHWMHATEDCLIANGVFTAEELAERVELFMREPDTEIPDVESPELMAAIEDGFLNVHSIARDVEDEPKFRVGDRVNVREHFSADHTRAPRYCRGRTGFIERVNPAYVFPDVNLAEDREEAHYTYEVRFDFVELWGEAVNPRDAVVLDLWEPYLENSTEGVLA